MGYSSTLAEIRNHRPGDMGYITHRHAIIYSAEHDFDCLFESHISRFTALFLDNFDPASERCWIAEKEGQFLGCIMLTADQEVPGCARIRCFLVEKTTRGEALGSAQCWSKRVLRLLERSGTGALDSRRTRN
ncbi:MarR-family transcriptional regulator [Colletotrichum kahawae]|uniref:MarR-family transcriptional regulator n=1 Tax=Colletotrichum kahawae TaxID=34407 RepID=A0AAE0D1V0_COLKA|nr:MarR-family transcriptional regulator [Colletotrichum kahawae]